MKTLYFEGAGWSGADISKATVGNCRIRTAFHLDDGRAVYLEVIACERRIGKTTVYEGWVDDCHIITEDGPQYTLGHFAPFEYNHTGILQLVNSLGCSFDAVEVLHDLAGYRVHAGGRNGYNFGDEFVPDAELIKARQNVDAWIRKKEIARGEKSICYSLWVDDNEPALLHYKNFRTGETFDIYPGIPKDLTQLPGLQKVNAVPGCFYGWCDGWQQLYRTYRISEEYARENELMYLDRCETSAGDYALPGSDVFRR